MIVHSSDLLGTGMTNLRVAANRAERVRDHDVVGRNKTPIGELDAAIDEALSAVADLIVARYGIIRRNPGFHERDSNHMVERLGDQMVTAISNNPVWAYGRKA